MLMATIVFCGIVWCHYKSLAYADVPKRPNFKHSNNTEFLHSVKQCVDYVYYHNDVEEVNLELLICLLYTSDAADE